MPGFLLGSFHVLVLEASQQHHMMFIIFIIHLKKQIHRSEEHAHAGGAQIRTQAGPGTKSVLSLLHLWHPNLV